jgi:hypothetical protein
MTTRDELTTELETIANMKRTELELWAYGMKVERDALKAVVDADIKVADACNHANLMLFAHIDYSGPAEISYAAAVAVQREALAHYRKEHP